MFNKETYVRRRQQLRNKISKGIILMLGNNNSPMNYTDNFYHFRQDSSFLYLFGLDFPKLAGAIDLDTGEEIIFGNDFSFEDIIWMGTQVPLIEKCEKVGITKIDSIQNLYNYIRKALTAKRIIHYLPPYRADIMIFLSELLGIHINKIINYSSIELVRALVDLRSIKEKQEIEEMVKAGEIAYEMHTTAMKMAKPGVKEQTISGTIEGIAKAKGGMIAYPIILSQNGDTLHNHDHSQILKNGRLMLIDAGAELESHYASDLTRIVPIGGKFTQKQKEIYNIVLAANNYGRQLTKPGISYLSVHLAAAEIITEGLKQLGLMKGEVKEAVIKGAHTLFFPHGFGHMLGLDAHDMENLGEEHVGYDDEIHRINQFGTAYLRLGKRLKPGFVITNEPGIYFIPSLIEKWKAEKTNADFINFNRLNEYYDFGGIRLEDNIVVTESGCKIIGNRLPITVDDIERIMY
jgi:Xaa-Pro aminopeptidase